MCLQSHLDELRRKHRALDEKIERMKGAPSAWADVQRLKKDKLHLKEAIVKAETRLKRQQVEREKRSDPRSSASVTPLPLPAVEQEALRPAA